MTVDLSCPCGCEYMHTGMIQKTNGDLVPIGLVECLRCGKRRYWSNDKGAFEPEEVVKAWIGEVK